jgi:superfamily II DNA/RNA helicase
MFEKKLNKSLFAALLDAGIAEANEVQKKCISPIKSGGDMICIAPDGFGKTTTLVISVIQQLTGALNDVPRAIVVTDTKEKALEVKAVFDLLGKNTNLRVVCSDVERRIDIQRDKIYVGCDVIVGTAKRLNELYSISGINLNGLRMFVVDDAELVMRQSITSQIDRLATYMPKSQRLVFANAFTDRVERYSEMFMHNPTLVEVEDDEIV